MFYDMIQKYIDSFYRRHYAIISTSSFEEESVDNWIVFARDRGAVYSHVDSLGNGLVSSSIGPYETVSQPISTALASRSRPRKARRRSILASWAIGKPQVSPATCSRSSKGEITFLP
jgi:hypothetical protein